MAAPKDNNYNLKWKTPEERKAVCKRFCEHIEQGYTVDCFEDCDFKTIKRYINDYPEDFPSDMISAAKRKSRIYWEGLGIRGTEGLIDKFNAKSWEFNMSNRYGWGSKTDVNRGDEIGVEELTDEQLSIKLQTVLGQLNDIAGE